MSRLIQRILLGTALLDNGRRQLPIPDTAPTLGALDVLPLEVLHNVLLELDLQSLTTLRAVNRYARHTIDGIYQYKIIISYAPSVLRAALAVGAASWISCSTLYATLCDQACSHCRDFGTFIYLLSCQRVCFLCLSHHKDFLPLAPYRAREEYGLTKNSLGEVRTITTLPGEYSYDSLPRRKRVLLVDRTDARNAGIKLHGSSALMETFVKQHRFQMIARYKQKLRQMPATRVRRPPCPPYRNQFDDNTHNPLRFMATVRAPWVKAQSGIADWGLSCRGCWIINGQIEGIRRLDRRRMFSSDGFIDHVKDCRFSQEAFAFLSSSDTDTQLTSTRRMGKTS